jgi:RNA polymerase sigma-70 factor (ECF subfamily)
MEHYSRPVVNLAYRFLDNRADAEEVAQEVFLRLYQHPPKIPQGASLLTWLYRVTVHRCIDLIRQRRKYRTVPLDTSPSAECEEPADRKPFSQTPLTSAGSVREEVMALERAALVRQAVAQLPDPLRIPLVLSTFKELSHLEIAKILGISEKAVERRLARARRILKARLEPYL